MLKYFLLSLFLFTGFFPTHLFAQNLQSERLIQEQQRLRAEEERRERQQRLEKSLEEEKEKESEKKEKPKGRCFEISEINIKGNTKLSQSKKNQTVDSYLDQCLSLAEIDEIIRSLTQEYVEAGYVTTRVYLPKQNLKSGKLILQVIEGAIEKIELNENSESDERRGWLAFPTDVDEILNLKDLDKGIGNLNSVPSTEAKMQIAPGSKPGLSTIKVKAVDQNASRYGISYDNLGQRSTGENRFRLTGDWDNLLSANETVSLMLMSNVDLWESEHHTRVYNLRYGMPIGYWHTGVSFLWSEYLTTSYGSFGLPIETSGETKKFTWDLERELIKTRRFHFSLVGQFNYYDTNSYIFDALNPASTYDLTTFSFGAKGSLFSLGTYWTYDLSYKKGIPWFGAVDDQSALAFDDPKAQFEKFMMTLSGQKSWENKGNPIRLSIVASGQTTDDTLYNVENIVIGDRYSVRGFKEDSVIGGRGFYAQSDLSYGFRYPQLTSWFLDPVQNFDVFVGFDMGEVSRFGVADQISGWSVGLKGYGRHTRWELVYSELIKAPLSFEKEKVIYVNFSLMGF